MQKVDKMHLTVHVAEVDDKFSGRDHQEVYGERHFLLRVSCFGACPDVSLLEQVQDRDP